MKVEEVLNKAIIAVIVGIVLATTGVLFYALALRLGSIAKENQTYNRYISCVLSVPSHERDQAKIDMCWTQVQKDTGVEVERYDHQK